MIFCENCGAQDDDAMNMDWTIGVKDDRVTNVTCKKCGGWLVANMLLPDGSIFILEEHDDDQQFINIGSLVNTGEQYGQDTFKSPERANAFRRPR